MIVRHLARVAPVIRHDYVACGRCGRCFAIKEVVSE